MCVHIYSTHKHTHTHVKSCSPCQSWVDYENSINSAYCYIYIHVCMYRYIIHWIQTQKRFKRMLVFIRTSHNMYIFVVIPYIKLTYTIVNQ